MRHKLALLFAMLVAVLLVASLGPYLGAGPIQGETWRPYIPTPNFPEYTSGHSTFSAAAAAVLKDFRGTARRAATAASTGSSATPTPATSARSSVRAPSRWPRSSGKAADSPSAVLAGQVGRRVRPGRFRLGPCRAALPRSHRAIA
jgi:hypothetical protein